MPLLRPELPDPVQGWCVAFMVTDRQGAQLVPPLAEAPTRLPLLLCVDATLADKPQSCSVLCLPGFLVPHAGPAVLMPTCGVPVSQLQ